MDCDPLGQGVSLLLGFSVNLDSIKTIETPLKMPEMSNHLRHFRIRFDWEKLLGLRLFGFS